MVGRKLGGIEKSRGIVLQEMISNASQRNGGDAREWSSSIPFGQNFDNIHESLRKFQRSSKFVEIFSGSFRKFDKKK